MSRPIVVSVRFVLSGLWLALIATLPATASPVVIEAVFTMPDPRQRDETIVKRLIAETEAVPRGGSIDGAFYYFTDPALAHALATAHRRGVRVRLIVDRKIQRPDAAAVRDLLVEALGPPCRRDCAGLDRSVLAVCGFRWHVVGAGCHGDDKTHNKFMIFRTAAETVPLLAVTSSNIEDDNFRRSNDLLLIRHAATVGRFESYWHDLARNRHDPAYGDRHDAAPQPLDDAVPEAGSISVHLFPRSAGDPVMDLLNRVRCQAPGSAVRVLHSMIGSGRQDLVWRLAELHQQGCDVRVVTDYRPKRRTPATEFLEAFGPDAGAVLSLLDRQACRSTHAKFMLVRAALHGSPDLRSFVLTGSHNLNEASLRDNDDNLLVIEQPELFSRYWDYWHQLHTREGARGFVPVQVIARHRMPDYDCPLFVHD